MNKKTFDEEIKRLERRIALLRAVEKGDARLRSVSVKGHWVKKHWVGKYDRHIIDRRKR